MAAAASGKFRPRVNFFRASIKCDCTCLVAVRTKLTQMGINREHFVFSPNWDSQNKQTKKNKNRNVIFFQFLHTANAARPLCARVIYQQKCTQNWFFSNLLFSIYYDFFVVVVGSVSAHTYTHTLSLYSFFRAPELRCFRCAKKTKDD